MFAQNACGPATDRPSVPPMPASVEPKVVHLLLVRTPSLTPRGLAWLQRSHTGEFDGLQLTRLIRMEKLSLG
jgi:hypothetical protein